MFVINTNLPKTTLEDRIGIFALPFIFSNTLTSSSRPTSFETDIVHTIGETHLQCHLFPELDKSQYRSQQYAYTSSYQSQQECKARYGMAMPIAGSLKMVGLSFTFNGMNGSSGKYSKIRFIKIKMNGEVELIQEFDLIRFLRGSSGNAVDTLFRISNENQFQPGEYLGFEILLKQNGDSSYIGIHQENTHGTNGKRVVNYFGISGS